MSDETKKNEYSDTLNLPKTDFPIRAQFSISDSIMLQRWNDEKLSEKTFVHNQGKTKFILHDGPPYANGNIHLGHAYNKISKDIITKAERMTGKHVPVIPGWDCHGLPIELKVTQETPGLSSQDLKKACRKYAQKWIDIQREEFKNLGVMMNWDKPYTTMDFSYEASILRAFKEFFGQGYIQKKLKTVPWCASCQTVLANAEIEYAERKDPSIYVQFPLPTSVTSNLFPEFDGKQVSLLVWTTTPWTLPLNRAVVLRPGAQYSLVEMSGKLVILGKDLVEKVAGIIGEASVKTIKAFASEILIGQKVNHPFITDLQVPIIGDGFVSLEDGTACVHSAPGCGPEDYEVGIKNNLEIYSPITADGKYSSEINPLELIGMSVADGQIWVIKKLVEVDNVLFKQSIRHSFPHCWRCRNGLIFRATSQWFCDLSKHDLKDHALEAIQSLEMIPQSGKNRFSATLEGRLEWCLSRQRSWGVPIPALNCLDCGHTFTSVELIETAAQGVEKDGIEFWDTVSVEQLGVKACVSCLSNSLRKEFDILDVWFESGVSHFAVLLKNPSQAYPADMYLEGKDQHRAWFQSSLLTSLVLEKSACMKEILTHGFTVDAQGKKMSKSIGNVVSPGQIIDKVGTDGLRLWVASSDYDSDPVVSELLLKNISEVYRKVRNTSRFLLSNLYDFDNEKDAVKTEDMLAIDQLALVRLHKFNMTMQAAYRERKTTAVFHELADYCAKDLSAFYLDIIKDRLYVEKADGRLRRSAQTVCYQILHTMTTIMAPILSLTAEQIFDFYKRKEDGNTSIHLQDFADTVTLFNFVVKSYGQHNSHKRTLIENHNEVENEFLMIWEKLSQIRGAVLKSLEILRGQGVIKHSLDSFVRLHINSSFADFEKIENFYLNLPGQSAQAFFKEYLIVSQVELVPVIKVASGVEIQDQGESMKNSFADSSFVEALPGLFINVTKASGLKCNRCWQWSDDCVIKNLTDSVVDNSALIESPAVSTSGAALCGRCAAVLDKRPSA
ncbi:MAG: isoleucine--tRNA ligase [Candidatus Dependentiae bacterium]|nr:isoleucine--tRNA ligase [Candidatus Dependentiae bacterium]